MNTYNICFLINYNISDAKEYPITLITGRTTSTTVNIKRKCQ